MTDDPEITDPRDPHKRPDIVTELDRYLVRDETVGFTEMVQRARDEIVALRGYRDECERQFQEQVAATGRLFDRLWLARAEALEEAARVCEGGYTTGSTASTLKAVAKAIRALKEEHG